MTETIPDIYDLFNAKTEAYIYDCYDGDTCKAIVTIPSTEIKVRVTCRMSGYDSAEIRTHDTNEKRLGYICRDKLRELVHKKNVLLTGQGKDKYGRLMTILETIEGVDVNQCMIDSNLGHPYGGGTKPKVTYNNDNSFVRGGTTYRY